LGPKAAQEKQGSRSARKKKKKKKKKKKNKKKQEGRTRRNRFSESEEEKGRSGIKQSEDSPSGRVDKKGRQKEKNTTTNGRVHQERRVEGGKASRTCHGEKNNKGDEGEGSEKKRREKTEG